MPEIPGIHHVTAFCDEPQANYDFFTDVLGLRFVKQTVRFDVPEKIYHLYYGDEQGTPGTVVTYFPMQEMPMEQGLVGKGGIDSVGLTIPEGSADFWRDRLQEHDVEITDDIERYGEDVIGFTDPDGVPFELKTGDSDIEPWSGADVPEEYAIQGMHDATIHSRDPQGTMDVLETMGWDFIGEYQHFQAGDRMRYEAPGNAPAGRYIDVLIRPNAPEQVLGIGTWLHVAFRAKNDWEQDRVSDILRENGYITTSTKDRDYFHSRYITEPGGAIFEYATDGPGFALDEDVEEFGQHMRIPDWLEVDAQQVKEMLPPLDVN